MTEKAGKVLVVLGAGPGLGMSMAHRFGREGFRVALVSRTDRRHEGYRASLTEAGIEAHTYTADVTDAADLKRVLGQITVDLGGYDTVYFGPVSPATLAVVPLTEAGAAELLAPMDNLLTAAATLVGEVVPGMVSRGDGALFFGGGLSGKIPMPMLGNLAPASAALRMYVLTLAEALKDKGVYAATLTIGGLIERGDIHRSFVDRDPSLEGIGTLDPDDIAATAWTMYVDRDRTEAEFGVPVTSAA
ncbi:SDR family oxidoreductase [Amycolatopsis sp. 195334CR]|uniref:SDR family NAD(P)-dependent oxidoreductase n=1 Tax=Amycolatopsis sp. 195334CR TaxID=2814588 RepID=UPI001A8D3FF8|nr:SDR family NAD(P)-dependent oxidoreductase [Amycolatopsis sp. 195334CR]MBN6041246.1 SDR family NAD(P)-dependent oxidoreductase [Amycolatopsis sp. 195334CR]